MHSKMRRNKVLSVLLSLVMVLGVLSVLAVQTLAAPATLGISNGDGYTPYDLEWEGNWKATFKTQKPAGWYRIDLYKDDELIVGGSTLLAKNGTASKSMAGNITEDGDYHFVAFACEDPPSMLISYGEVAVSEVKTFVNPSITLDNPSNLRWTAQANKVFLEWDTPANFVDGTDSYEVYVRNTTTSEGILDANTFSSNKYEMDFSRFGNGWYGGSTVREGLYGFAVRSISGDLSERISNSEEVSATTGYNYPDGNIVDLSSTESDLDLDDYRSAHLLCIIDAITTNVSDFAGACLIFENIQTKELVPEDFSNVVLTRNGNEVIPVRFNFIQSTVIDTGVGSYTRYDCYFLDIVNIDQAGEYRISFDLLGRSFKATETLIIAETDDPVNPKYPAFPRPAGNAGSGRSFGGSSGSGGGSSGGSTITNFFPSSSTSGAVVSSAAPATVTVSTVTDLVKEAVKADGSTAVVSVKNATDVALDTFKAMVNASGNKAVRFDADSISADGKSVEVRISINPANATKNLNLLASTTSAAANAVKASFEKNYSNNITVINLSQQGDFGVAVEIAVKIDSNLNTKTLLFYSYDKTTNTHKPITAPNYSVDSNGYVHFTTKLAGDIIITDTQLAKK